MVEAYTHKFEWDRLASIPWQAFCIGFAFSYLIFSKDE